MEAIQKAIIEYTYRMELYKSWWRVMLPEYKESCLRSGGAEAYPLYGACVSLAQLKQNSARSGNLAPKDQSLCYCGYNRKGNRSGG